MTWLLVLASQKYFTLHDFGRLDARVECWFREKTEGPGVLRRWLMY